jgi:hypothetical protein
LQSRGLTIRKYAGNIVVIEQSCLMVAAAMGVVLAVLASVKAGTVAATIDGDRLVLARDSVSESFGVPQTAA